MKKYLYSLGAAILWWILYITFLVISRLTSFPEPIEPFLACSSFFMPFLFWVVRYVLNRKKLWHFSGTILFCCFNLLNIFGSEMFCRIVPGKSILLDLSSVLYSLEGGFVLLCELIYALGLWYDRRNERREKNCPRSL